jgi:hypothetical protein
MSTKDRENILQACNSGNSGRLAGIYCFVGVETHRINLPDAQEKTRSYSHNQDQPANDRLVDQAVQARFGKVFLVYGFTGIYCIGDSHCNFFPLLLLISTSDIL